MEFATFTIYNSLGAIVWAGAFGTLGYLFGDSLPALRHNIGLAALAVAGVVGAGIAVYYFRHRKRAVPSKQPWVEQPDGGCAEPRSR